MGLKMKSRKSQKILILLVFLPKLYQMGFVYLFLYFVVVDHGITLFNCFFRDFRVFNLTEKRQNRLFWH